MTIANAVKRSAATMANLQPRQGIASVAKMLLRNDHDTHTEARNCLIGQGAPLQKPI